MLVRTEFQHKAGAIDDASYEARLGAIKEAWLYPVVGQTEVSSAMTAVSAAAKNGVGPDNASFQTAVESAKAACAGVGSFTGFAALPGMGDSPHRSGGLAVRTSRQLPPVSPDGL